MRYLLYRFLTRTIRRLRPAPSDPYARLLAQTGLTHGEREALLALRH